MNEKERLIELINNYPCMSTAEHCFIESISEDIADYLLANGVIVPPCKVGDKVWVLWGKEHGLTEKVHSGNVYALRFDTKKNNMRICVEGRFEVEAYGGRFTHYYNATFAWKSVGKTVFLTKAEAEKALAERGKTLC